MKPKDIAIFVSLVTVGSMQMIGDLTGSAETKGLGAALHVSPAPRVFTTHDGFETFSSQFFIHWQDENGGSHSLELTAKNYEGIRGPYNRRNVFGAALSYGPVLNNNPATKDMFSQVSRYAFCGAAPALKELGVDSPLIRYPIAIELRPKDKNSINEKWQLTYSIDCDETQVEDAHHA